jgi:hypothetical protein
MQRRPRNTTKCFIKSGADAAAELSVTATYTVRSDLVPDLS